MRRLFSIAARTLRDAFLARREYMRPIGPLIFRNLDLGEVIVREATDDAIAPLEAFLSSGDFAKHADRLKAQQSGIGTYLIAWHLVPVGHIYIAWNGGSDGPLAERRGKEPFLEDLYIHPAARRRGIGKMLMDEAESLIRKRGYQKVGLTIRAENPNLRALYRNRGYEDSNLGVFQSRRLFRDRKGHEKVWSAQVIYVVKTLENRDHGNKG